MSLPARAPAGIRSGLDGTTGQHQRGAKWCEVVQRGEPGWPAGCAPAVRFRPRCASSNPKSPTSACCA